MAIRAALKKSVRVYQLPKSSTLTVGTATHFAQLPAQWAGVATAHILELLDGRRCESQISIISGVAPEQIEALLKELQRHDLIDLHRTPISYLERYNPASGTVEKLIDTEKFPSDYAIQTFLNRIEVECDAATFNSGDIDGGRTAVLARREFSILIFGRGRIVNALVGMLSATGFTQFNVINRLRSRHPALKISETDMAGGFITMRHIGQSRRKTIEEIKNAAALFDEAALPIAKPNLIICIGAPAPDALQRWISEGTPHLLIESYSSAEVRVGPLVIPGKTPCYRCLQLAEINAFPALANSDTKTEFQEVGIALVFAAASSIVADITQISATGKSVFLATSITYSMRSFHRPQRTNWSSHPGCGCSWS